MKRSYLSLMKDRGFVAFLGTQFLSALNDNLLKWILTFMAMDHMLKGGSSQDGANLEHISEIFIFPSLLFTGLAGWLADNYSKSKVLIVSKSFEIVVMGLAFWALQSGYFAPPLFVL